MRESPLRMDLFIAGLGRAGTTLLANLLTVPPKRWVLIEPGITRADMGEHVRLQAADFGIEVSPRDWNAVANEDAFSKFERILASRLQGLERWGVKEVNPTGWDELIARFNPRHVVLMVRDLRDAAMSVLEKEERNPGIRKTPEWLFDRLSSAASALVRLHAILPAQQITTVRYEDVVGFEAERQRIEMRLGWPLDGDPRQRLEIYGREFEIARHRGGLTSSSVGRTARASSLEHLFFAERLRNEHDAFARVFGYT